MHGSEGAGAETGFPVGALLELELGHGGEHALVETFNFSRHG